MATPHAACRVAPLLAAITIDLGGGTFDDRSSRAGFVLLAAFLVTWLFIRTSARLMRSPRVPWWPGSVETKGGLHIHHMVFGITLLMLTGFLAITFAPVSPRL